MKAQLDLLWNFCYFAQVRPINYIGLADRFALLHWIQERTSVYKNINVTDFVTGCVLPQCPSSRCSRFINVWFLRDGLFEVDLETD